MNIVGKLIAVVIVATLSLSVRSAEATPRYVGALKCKACHNRKDQVNQYEIWSNSGHAKAFATLATDKAKAFAAKAGVKGDPQKAAECLECHVTGFAQDTSHYGDTYKLDEGVQCEACHGPGADYKAATIMSTTKYAADRETQHKLAVKAGLLIPNEQTCVKCHNERSPAFTGFVFKDYYERIKHQYQR